MYFDYIKIRKQIEAICTNPHLSIEERAAQIYPLLPVTDEDIKKLYFGTNSEDKWNLASKAEGKSCDKLIDDTASIIPVEMIIKKYQDVMDANPIDIKAITNLERNISKVGSFYGVYWYQLPDYMDTNIALPVFPGAELASEYNVARTDAFIKLLKQQSDDYVLHFMLLVALESDSKLLF